MDRLRHIWRVYAVPGAVFQSMMIGGGYGTGREIVEYFSRYGLLGGLLGLGAVAVSFAVLLGLSYEFARVYRAYDYRSFFRTLLGRGWIAFEVVYLVMFALVLAVIAAATASLVEEYLHLPGALGVSILLLLVIVFAFYGRQWVTRILAYKALILMAVFGFYFVALCVRSGYRITAEFGLHQIVTGWVSGAVHYVLYSSVVIPAVLFATRGIESRREAVTSGVASAVLGVLPAVLLHLSFGAAYPDVLGQPIPAYWMIAGLGIPLLTGAYLVVLFGSLFDVGLGFIQSVNERVDGWSLERRGRKISRLARAGVAVVCALVSGSLSFVGIVKLIAQGYGTMAYGFLVLFVGPLLTVGVYRLSRKGVLS